MSRLQLLVYSIALRNLSHTTLKTHSSMDNCFRSLVQLGNFPVISNVWLSTGLVFKEQGKIKTHLHYITEKINKNN